MSFDAIIRVLRDGADVRCKWAAENRQRAAGLQAEANEFTTKAAKDEEVAQAFDLLADALASGQLTTEQLRAIVAGATAEPIDPFDAYTDAQLDGLACIGCGGDLTDYGNGSSPNSRPAENGPRGQMFVHSNPDDCKGADQ